MKPIYFKILFMLLLGMAAVQLRAGITLLSPNGGEVFHNQVIVRWSANGATSKINIYLSTDEGNTYTSEILGYNIAPNDTGSKTLNTLNSSRRSNRCYIRIEDSGTPASFDISNDSFAIQVNYAPQAYDSLNTPMNHATTFVPDIYDADPGDKHIITPTSTPANGNVIALNDSTFNYTPNPGFVGYDSFSVNICDDGTPSLCGYGFIRIYVGCGQLKVDPGANATICSTSGYVLGGNPTASGGTAPYTYYWSPYNYTMLDDPLIANPVITSNYSGAKTVALRVTDANGCLADTIVSITGGSSGNLIIQNGIINTGCLGNTGSIDIGVSGGGTYAYSWSNGATTEDVSGLQSGTYIVSVSDGSTCISTKSFVVGEDTAAFVINQDNLQPAGCQGNGGAIRVIATGPGAPFTYAWSNGATVNEITGLSAGTYTVTVANNSGCTLTRSFGISSSSASFSIQDTIFPSNCGSSNGEIELIVTGPGAPFTYLWSNGSTGSAINGLSAGLYFVTVRDNAGCETRDSFNVTSSPVFSIVTDAKKDESCAGNDGSVALSISGGGAPFTYSWSTGATTEDISGLDSGQYSLTVTNSFGCTVVGYYYIIPSAELHITRDSIVRYTCGIPATGYLAVSVSGGNAPYTYLWSNNVSTDNEISGLPGGVYIVYVEDSSGCSATYSDTIFEVPNLSISGIVTNIGCNTLGAIDISVVGTAGPYTFEWSNTGNAEDLNGISIASSYSVTVSSTSGCSGTKSFTVVDNPNTLMVRGVDTVLCMNQEAKLVFYQLGGTSPYKYKWLYPGSTNSDTTANLVVSPAVGTTIPYIIIVTDAGGCTKADTIIVQSINDSVSVVVDSIRAQSCNGALGSIFITASSNVLPLTYDWTLFGVHFTGSSEDLVNKNANVYHYRVENPNGCVNHGIVEIPLGFKAKIDDSDNTFCSVDTMKLSALATQGFAPYTYTWLSSVPAFNSNAQVLKAFGAQTAFVRLKVTDSTGCNAFDSAYIYIDTCVWPGDANYDGIVSVDDLLNIGIAYGDTGSYRGNGINWAGIRTMNWINDFADGLNHKHADCNGDAIINHDDTMAVTVNYSKTHARSGWENGNRMVDPVLTTTFSADTTYAGQGLTAQVQLGTSTLPATDVFGIAFRMNFPPGKVDTFLGLDFTGNWLTAGNANAIYFRKLNMAQGFVDICVVRTDGTNRTGFGLLANASFVMKDDITGKNDNRTFSTFEITYSNVKMISANEDVLSVFAEDKETVLAQFPNGIGQVDEIKATVYPNPVHQTMLLVADGMLQQVELVNGLGSNVNVPVELKGNTANVDASGLTAGVYYLHLTTANGKAVKRIVKY